ncbi:hypothetical protein WME89_19090 [Sorangium sp. So ce321]|uniref:hypothetical protein n=1 Tax=Sorangium sp. So ce321 TaxID=3133300 RepID=UPI003F5E920D
MAPWDAKTSEVFAMQKIRAPSTYRKRRRWTVLHAEEALAAFVEQASTFPPSRVKDWSRSD